MRAFAFFPRPTWPACPDGRPRHAQEATGWTSTRRSATFLRLFLLIPVPRISYVVPAQLRVRRASRLLRAQLRGHPSQAAPGAISGQTGGVPVGTIRARRARGRAYPASRRRATRSTAHIMGTARMATNPPPPVLVGRRVPGSTHEIENLYHSPPPISATAGVVSAARFNRRGHDMAAGRLRMPGTSRRAPCITTRPARQSTTTNRPSR